ncbi:MAG: DnaJ domain-containing protein [Solirubrobacteraceae bacterium]
MRAGLDPYAVLGVRRGATDAQIHAAYRAAVRRTHPDAGGSSAAFEDVQDAYEQLRDAAKRGASPAQAPPRAGPRPAPAQAPGRSSMEDLLAESQRLEDEARKLAGMASRRRGEEEPTDSVGDVLRDAGAQLRDAADEGVRELRRFIRRRL